MSAIRQFIVRLLAHLKPARADAGINDELRYHIDRLVEQNIASGMTPAAARESARREFGNVGMTGDAMRDAARWAWLSRIERDLRYALRALRRTPVFAATVVLTIAVAIGLNATVFTLLDAYVLRPFAARDPSALHRVIVVGKSEGERTAETWMDWDAYQNLLKDSSVVTDALAYRDVYTRIDQVPAIGHLVSGNYFSALGVNVIRGRPIIPADVSGGDGFVVVISHTMWTSRFGADSGIVGRTISLRGRPFTVVGIAGPEFTGLTELPIDFWAPVTTADILGGEGKAPVYPVWPRAGVVVRLQTGVVPEVAQERIGRALARFSKPVPGGAEITGVELQSQSTLITLDGETMLALTPVAIAFILVLVIACANVANMMLARGLARQREIGIRMALGAGRRQVVGQLLTEAAVLAVPAALLGYFISRVTLEAGMRMLMASFPPAFAAYLRVVPLDPDVRVFAFMLLLAIATAVLFGLAPALQVTRASVVDATRGEFEGGIRPARMRNALVIVQMAGCVLLMAVAGVLMRGSTTAQRTDPGFNVAGVLHVELDDALREQGLAALRAHPLVAGIAAGAEAPARGLYSGTVMRHGNSTDERRTYYNRVSPGFFATARIPLREGRTFTDREASGEEPVVVVSETLARLVAPDGSAIGRELHLVANDEGLRQRRLRPFRTARIVGVVGDAAPGLVFIPRNVGIAYYPLDEAKSGALMVSVRGDELRATRTIETEVDRLYPGAVTDISPMGQAVDAQLYPLRAASWISGLLGMVTLALTLSGIYGVLAYLVAQRTREFGIRMSLGAQPGTVVAMVLRQALRLALIGGAIGLTIALGVAQVFASEALVIKTFDPVAYIGTAIVAVLACLLAAWVPSRRAASVNPLEALRHE